MSVVESKYIRLKCDLCGSEWNQHISTTTLHAFVLTMRKIGHENIDTSYPDLCGECYVRLGSALGRG